MGKQHQEDPKKHSCTPRGNARVASEYCGKKFFGNQKSAFTTSDDFRSKKGVFVNTHCGSSKRPPNSPSSQGTFSPKSPINMTRTKFIFDKSSVDELSVKGGKTAIDVNKIEFGKFAPNNER